MGYTFTKEERLRKRHEFLAVSGEGRKHPSRNFLVIVLGKGRDCTRVGITASRKVGNAVTRNRIKRSVREFYRLNKHLFPGGDYNIIARQGAAELDTSSTHAELSKLMRRVLHDHGH